MNQNDKKVKYEELKDLPGREILAKMKRKEITAPTEGEEKENFLKFANSEPGSEERTQLLTKLGVAPASAPAEKTGDSGVSDESSSAIGGSTDDAGKSGAAAPDASASADKPIEDVLKELGVKNIGELRKAHTELLQSVNSLNKQLSNARSSGGRVGQERDALKRELEQQKTRLKEVEEKFKPKPMEKPKRPKRPNPTDFDEGILDPKYQQKVAEHEVSMETYEEQIEIYANSMKPGWAEELEKGLRETTATVDEIKGRTDTTYQSESQRKFDESWEGFWGGVEKLQGQFKLKTTVPAKDINEFRKVLENATAKDEAGNRVYTDEQVSAAKTAYDKLPADDRANFAKVSKLAHAQYVFDDGVPKPKFKNVRSAIIESGLEQEFPFLTEVGTSEADRVRALAESQKRGDSAAAGMSASDLGANDDKLSAPKSRSEKAKRLGDLLAIRKKNPAYFKGNPELTKEAQGLAKELDLRWPNS